MKLMTKANPIINYNLLIINYYRFSINFYSLESAAYFKSWIVQLFSSSMAKFCNKLAGQENSFEIRTFNN